MIAARQHRDVMLYCEKTLVYISAQESADLGCVAAAACCAHAARHAAWMGLPQLMHDGLNGARWLVTISW